MFQNKKIKIIKRRILLTAFQVAIIYLKARKKEKKKEKKKKT